MTLEDFFTLSELKDGLTAPDRVKELITIMQREKDTVVKNISEATRQWSTVATTIAATDNKNCLDLFIDLDGLCFIDKWLKDAQNLENDNENNFLVESIIALLRASEKLQIDNQRSLSSGIGMTVQNLVAHSSSSVSEKAQSLSDRWMLTQHDGVVPPDVKNFEPLGDDENMPLVSADIVQQVMIVNNEETTTPDRIMDADTANQEPLDHVDPICKSMRDDGNLLDKNEVPNCKSEANGKDLEQITSSADVDNTFTDQRANKDEDMVDDGASPNHVAANDLQDPPGGNCKWGEPESPKTSSDSESDEEAENGNEHGGIQSIGHSGTGSHFFKSSLNGSKTSDMELDYGMIDPLAVARQVAMEVEREVDSREQSCSTSEKPDSTNGQEGQPDVSSEPEPEPEPEPSPKFSPLKDSETLVSERVSSKLDVTASQISELAQESEPNIGKVLSGFDLNQEVCSEEVDNPINPVTSRAAAATDHPTAPLQFEGTLGWKGSASTSAFRRIPESDRPSSSSRPHSNSKQHLNHLDFDLNVTESSEDKIEDFLSRNKTTIVSGEESSVEVSPRRPEKLQLDLNSPGDENGWRSPSFSSSSSSKHPSLRNIDLNLNDHPVSVFSLFGTKFEVNTKDYLAQSNRRGSDPTVDFNLARTGAGLGYGNPPLYGHNGFPSGSAMFFSYGPPGVPIPYMVDSRGAAIVAPPPPPFFMNMAAPGGAPSGSSGPAPPQHSFDLNTCLAIDGGNRETMRGLRQLFPHNNSSSSSSSIVGTKRREPDTNWEFYNRQQPPWR